ncbi:MAG TPA: TonB-dependent receptor [Rhizomicrobium sp.]
MRKSSLLTSAALFALLAPGFAIAADAPETVVVTATRTSQPVEKTGASIAIITGGDLQIQQLNVLSDALQQTPGVTVNRTGGVGQVTTVSLRGAEAGQTVALIDGIRINDPSDVSEGAMFGDLLVNNIDRVEVLRGPQSTLYGSDAIGGIVNVITKRGGPFALTASAEGGSFNTYRLNLAASGTQSIAEYGLAINAFGTKGVSAADSRNGNPEADGYRNLGATFNTRFHLSDDVSVDLRGYYTRGHSGFDDNYAYTPPYQLEDSDAKNTNQLYAGYAGLNGDLFGGRFHNRLALIATSSTRQFFDSASDTLHLNYEYSGDAVRFEYQGTVDIGADSQATFGAESEQRSFRNNNYYSYMPADSAAGHDRITGIYGQIQSTLFDQLTLTGGVRYDDDKEFGSHTSVKLAAAWQVPVLDATLRANYGDGFKAPSLYQLYSPYSNPIAALKPETARGWEVGADKDLWDGRVRASLTYFERRTKNQIDFQSCYTPADAPGCPQRLAQYGYYINLGRTRATGVEAAIVAEITDTLKLAANYTNLSAVNTGTGTDLARRPRDTANATVTWLALQDLTLGASIRYLGKRFNDAGNFTPLTSNTKIDLFGAYDLAGNWQLFGRVDNLLNDRTEYVSGYGTPGLAATFGVRTRL